MIPVLSGKLTLSAAISVLQRRHRSHLSGLRGRRACHTRAEAGGGGSWWTWSGSGPGLKWLRNAGLQRHRTEA